MKLLRCMLYLMFALINSASFILGCPVCFDEEDIPLTINTENIPPHLTLEDILHIYGYDQKQPYTHQDYDDYDFDDEEEEENDL